MTRCKKCEKYLGVSGCTAFCDEYCLDKYVTEQLQLSNHLIEQKIKARIKELELKIKNTNYWICDLKMLDELRKLLQE